MFVLALSKFQSHLISFTVQGPTSNGEAPNPYVKLYLLPDPMKQTKKKTKISKNSFNPTYNEMVCFYWLSIVVRC